MPRVTFLPHEKFCPEGLTVEVEPGVSIADVAHDNDIEIEMACGGVPACTTCHCIVRKGFDSLQGEVDELEEDLLDKAWGLEPHSRLACQAKVGDQDVTVEIPKYSLNHAAEAPH